VQGLRRGRSDLAKAVALVAEDASPPANGAMVSITLAKSGRFSPSVVSAKGDEQRPGRA
jgi:hypothetical protein